MSLPDFSVEGMTAIVTGASRGIGAGIAITLAEAGADLCLAARSEQDLREVGDQIRKLGCKCIEVKTDIANGDDVDRLVQTAIDTFGRVDILVNNAGMMVVKPMVPLPGFRPATAASVPGFFDRASEAEWRQVMDVNVKGAFLCMRAVAPHMIERKKGKIISVSSINAVKSARYRFSYDASKAALSQLTRSMAVEWARYNVNVNAIGAGYVRTALTETSLEDERLREKMLSEIPLRRVGTPREMGLMAVYLASPAADYITGQTLFIDGGVLA